MMKLYRLLDANFNRAREGLRVVEDIVRFILDDADAYREIKDIRLQLGYLNRCLEEQYQLLAHRQVEQDVGTSVTLEAEKNRDGLTAVMAANFKRIEEALRVLEESVKLLEPDLCLDFKRLRYQAYKLEKQTYKAILKVTHQEEVD